MYLNRDSARDGGSGEATQEQKEMTDPKSSQKALMPRA